MKYGNIHCSCGKEFYFETARKEIACIECGKIHDVSEHPKPGIKVSEEGE